MKSMTGFARKEIETPYIKGTITIKAYNNRYLEISAYLPPYLAALESKLRGTISKNVIHGKVEVALRIREVTDPPSVMVDTAAASACVSALNLIAQTVGIKEPLRVSDIMSFDGVVSFERTIDTDAVWEALQPCVVACLADFDIEREREGLSTREDIDRKLLSINKSLGVVKTNDPAIEMVIRENLAKSFKEVVGDAVDENRVLQEIASYLAKHTINEEIVRLSSHISAFYSTMEEPGCGKKLDFLCQEMNREVNTIGSKNILAPIGEAVVALKDAIENVREQLRNIE